MWTNIPASLAPALQRMIASEYFTEVQLQQIYRFAINNAQSKLQEAFWSYDAPIAAAKATGHSL